MIHIPPTTQFLSALFTSSLPLSQTREGESLLVTILGILSHIGRHPTITIPQNREIGNFLLSILPPSKIEVTIQVTLQAIDGVIDLYADEDSEWDKEVFREGGFGRRLEEAVKGVRAAVSLFFFFFWGGWMRVLTTFWGENRRKKWIGKGSRS